MPYNTLEKRRVNYVKRAPELNQRRRMQYATSPARFQRQPAAYWRWHNIWKKYGLTQDEWMALFQMQGGKCAVCGTDKKPAHGWHTDHGAAGVRGILCSRCNMGLGSFLHDPALLQCAADYIRLTTAAKVTGAKDDSRTDSTSTPQASRQPVSSLGADWPRK